MFSEYLFFNNPVLRSTVKYYFNFLVVDFTRDHFFNYYIVYTILTPNL